MIQFINGSSKELHHKDMEQLFAYRYSVFIEQLGWDTNTNAEIEIDEFDEADTIYIIAKDKAANIVGCARLLPTTKPYLLEKKFPELLNGLPPPKDASIWELSRFTSMALSSKISISQGQMSSPITKKLLKQAIKTAKQQGAKKIISVSPVGIERLLKKMGIHSHRAGPPKIINGYPLVACIIDLNQNL